MFLRRLVRFAVPHAIFEKFSFCRRDGRIHFHINLMDGAVGDGRGEGQAIFMADNLRDFTVSLFKGFAIHGKVGAATGGLRNPFQALVGGGKLFLCLLDFGFAAEFAVS